MAILIFGINVETSFARCNSQLSFIQTETFVQGCCVKLSRILQNLVALAFCLAGGDAAHPLRAAIPVVMQA